MLRRGFVKLLGMVGLGVLLPVPVESRGVHTHSKWMPLYFLGDHIDTFRALSEVPPTPRNEAVAWVRHYYYTRDGRTVTVPAVVSSSHVKRNTGKQFTRMLKQIDENAHESAEYLWEHGIHGAGHHDAFTGDQHI